MESSTETWENSDMRYDEATNDRHVGHYFKEYMQRNSDAIFQIDAATGAQETRRSVWSRSARLALHLRQLGLRPGDVVVLGGANHLDVHVPLYACALNGLPLAGVDPCYKYNELMDIFKIVAPKLAFCEPELYEDYSRAAQDLGLCTRIVTFGAGARSLAALLDTSHDQEPEHELTVATFDVTKVPCWLISTSGTTGVPKVTAHSHTNIFKSILPSFWLNVETSDRKLALNVSSTHWVSAYFNAILMPVAYVKLQTSAPATAECIAHVINKYKPVTTIITPTLLADILREEHCDLTCFDTILITGSKLHTHTLKDLQVRVRPDATIRQGYGLTEVGSSVLELVFSPDRPLGSLGTPNPIHELMLVDPATGRRISKPFASGELLVRGPRMMGYYNNPEATAAVVTPDGFLKTGDIFYHDENDYFFYVDRQKMLLKYRCYQVVPQEIEAVLITHPGVRDVCVTSVPHPVDEERAVACVLRARGAAVSAQALKDLVARQLSVHKHLHGGVVFLDEFPLTPSGKVHRGKVKEIVNNAELL